MKTDEQRRAQELRALGWSIEEIERELGVARSSVSVWVRHVELDAAARARLATRVGHGPIVAAELKAARAREVRRGYQEEGRVLAQTRDATYAAGCMIYWGEARRRGTPSKSSTPTQNSS